MEESTENAPGTNWNKILAWVFAFAFAMFWSLDAFFFWIFLSLAGFFLTLTIFNAAKKSSLFEQRPPQAEPYQSHTEQSQAPPEQGSTVDVGGVVRKIVRAGVIVFASVIAFLFIIGIIWADDSSQASSDQIDLATAYNDQGNVHYNQSNLDSAGYFYDKALEADPQHQYALYSKGLVLYGKKDYRSSITYVNRCLRLYPDYKQALWLLADDYYEVSNYDSALICAESAYDGDFKDPGFLFLLGDLYLKVGNRGRATEVFKELLGTDSTSAEVYEQLAELDPENATWYRSRAAALKSTQ